MRDEVAAAVRTVKAALAAIRRDPDAQERITDATQFDSELSEAAQAARVIRRDAVIDIYETGKYSLKGLADELGMSKARADQIIPADHPQRGDRKTRGKHE